MAHILFVSRYYSPEKAAAAVCVSETAKRLVQLGHEVTVLTTFPNYPTGIVALEYQGRMREEETIDGVRVVRVWSYLTANKGFLKRIVAQLAFGCLAPFLAGKKVGNPDVIIVGSPPLFNVIAARYLAWRKCVPLVFWVADLWPESAVQLGALRNQLLIKLSEWLEWSTYQRSGIVWAVTQGMYDTLIRRGLSPERVFLLTNGVDTDKFRPLPQAAARAELGWDDRFTILYAGTHGLTHGLTTLLDTAERLQERKDIRFVFAGDGAEKAHLITDAERRGLKNVTFLDPLPHDRMPQLLAAADVCVAHTRKLKVFEGMLPIKMYEAMSCGRPMLLALNGEARVLAEQEAGGAIYVEPENPEALANAVIHLYEHPKIAKLLGLRGREYVTKNYDYTLLTKKLEVRLMSLFKNKLLTHNINPSVNSTLPAFAGESLSE